MTSPAPRGRFVPGPDRYGLLLTLILSTLLLSAVVGEQPWARVAVTTAFGATTLFAFWTSRPGTGVLRWASVVVVISVVVANVAAHSGHDVLVDGTNRMIVVLLTAASVAVVARRILQHPSVQRSTVFGSLCIYLMIGLAFAYLFSTVGFFQGRFFAQLDRSTIVDYLYFSYVSLTTVGYGDLTPAENLGRMLAISETLIGQLYLVTVVALLVGAIGRGRFARRGAD